MLRNRGVNATERRIRHDVLRAYEYDTFDARPRWRCPHEPGCRSDFYRQPRYCTARNTRPTYFHTSRSTVSSYGVKRVYLPDEDYGAGSAESTIYFRNPRYSTGCYYPTDAYHTRGVGRPCRRDLKYEDYYSRGPPPVYIDDDDYYPKCSRYKKLVRKVTRKLSPIFPCDCATTSNVRQLKKNNKNDIDNRHHNDLSKEAKELSRDVFKIISLLQKADGEDEEQFSSSSLLQNIHNLDCHSSNSYAKLITQRVNIYPKMGKQKQVDPLTRFKSASGVRSKLEALVDALKQYETEKYLNRGSSNSDNEPKSGITTDPPSVETRSFFNGKFLKSSTTLFGGKRKDMVLQTEQPKTSNKSVCGKVKVKKGDSSAERKSLKSRLSWRRKEGSGIKMRRDSANERLSDKKTERKRSLFFKTKSKGKIKSIIESEQFQGKQGQTNKAGLMITIGGNSQRKKSASTKEKFKEKKPKPPKPPKPWIRRFVEENHDTRNSIRIRWNNKAFYAKSSSTIVELVHNVYKQLGINKNSKSDETTSKKRKPPKTITPKHSKTRMQKSTKKTKCKQKLEAYMIPQIIVPGPFCRPNVTNNYTDNNTSKPPEKSYLNEFTPKFCYGLNTTNVLSTNCFEILLPDNLFVSMNEEPTSDTEYKLVEYEATSKETIIDTVNGIIVYQEDLKESDSFEAFEHMHAKVNQMNNNSFCSRERSENSETNIILKEPESKPTKSRIQLQKLNAKETESQFFERSFCPLAASIIQAEYLHWMPMTLDSFVWAHCEVLDDIMNKSVRQIQISSIHDAISIKTDTNIATETVNANYIQYHCTNNVASKESKVYIRRKFNAFNNNLVQWKKRVTGTYSDSILGILSRKSVVISVLWSLVKILRKNDSPKTKRGPPPQDLSLVQPPGTVSQPDCSHKSLNHYLARRPLQSQKQKLTFEPLRLAQLASAALQAKKELALVKSSLTPIQCYEIANDAFEINKFETTEESDAITLDEMSGPINIIDTVQTTVRNETNIELDVFPSPLSKPSCRKRLVHSVSNLETEKYIKPKATRSVLLLQNRIYQTNSLLLLFVHPILYGHAGIEQTHGGEERQLQHLTECYPGSTEYEIQDIQLESVYSNKAPEATVNNSQDIIRSENRSHIAVQKLPSDYTDPVQVHTEKCQRQNTCYNERKNNKHLTYVTQMSKIKNNTFPLDIPCILDKKPTEQISVKVTKGDKITKILISNRKSNTKNNTKSTNLRISQDPRVTNNVGPIKSIKRISRKNVKVYINISNITDKEPENGENQLNKLECNNEFTDQFSKQKADERQVAVTEYTDFYTTDDAVGKQRCAVCKSDLLQPFTECLQNDDMNSTNTQHEITKSTTERRMNSTKFNDFKTDISPTDSYLYDIAAEEYVNEILGSADKIDRTKLRRVVGLRALQNMTLLNLSAFAEMAFKRELTSDHTDTYMSLRQQLKRRKKLVKILSEINMRNTTDCLGEQAKSDNADYFDDLQSSATCSLCNIMERKSINHHVKANIPTNFNDRGKRNIAANDDLSHLVSPFTKQCLELEEFMSSLKEDRISNSDTFIDIDDTGLGALLKRSMLYSKRNATEKMEAKPMCWCCVKNINRNSKKKQKKRQTEKHKNRYLRSCHNDDMILQRTDSSICQKSPFTEYKVRFKNDSMRTDDPIEKIYSEVKKSDILQSCKIKKAVIQLYSHETVNDGYLVAKLPKYLRM